MMTVLDGLDALEDGINSSELEGDGEGLEGGLEEECDINELRSDPNNNKEEVYNDNDDDLFNSLTSAGLPEQFDYMATTPNMPNMSNMGGVPMPMADIKEESLNSLVSEMRVGQKQAQVQSQAQVVQSIQPPRPPVAEVTPVAPTPQQSQPQGQQFLPPPPMPMAAPTPTPMQPPVPISQPITYANIRNLNNIRPAKYMSKYDMK